MPKKQKQEIWFLGEKHKKNKILFGENDGRTDENPYIGIYLSVRPYVCIQNILWFVVYESRFI